ncbi:MAG: aspartate aminotransferase family protein, partial [Candidatus Competibacteraceae bacterium]|nr:aspartate aminotransferase family protein [Candidatus Competibacteraceae bacterium]
VGDVRGLGLLLAVELVADKESKRQLPLELVAPSRFQAIALEQGLAVYSRRTAGGRFGDWFMVSPPLTVSSEQVEEIAQGLAKALRSYEEELAGQGVLG